jgi:hypothetical protein
VTTCDACAAVGDNRRPLTTRPPRRRIARRTRRTGRRCAPLLSPRDTSTSGQENLRILPFEGRIPASYPASMASRWRSRVARLTPTVRAISARGSPRASMSRIARIFDGVTTLRRPSVWPRALADARPALILSVVKSCSNSLMAASTWKIRRPVAEAPASMSSSSAWYPGRGLRSSRTRRCPCGLRRWTSRGFQRGSRSRPVDARRRDRRPRGPGLCGSRSRRRTLGSGLRVVFGVEHTARVAAALASAGTEFYASPTRTRWNSLHARLTALAGWSEAVQQ